MHTPLRQDANAFSCTLKIQTCLIDAIFVACKKSFIASSRTQCSSLQKVVISCMQLKLRTVAQVPGGLYHFNYVDIGKLFCTKPWPLEWESQEGRTGFTSRGQGMRGALTPAWPGTELESRSRLEDGVEGIRNGKRSKRKQMRCSKKCEKGTGQGSTAEKFKAQLVVL